MAEALRLLEGDAIKRRLARGSAQALAINSIGIGLAFLAQMALTRTLGSDGYGVYAFVFAWVTVLARFSTLGFETSLLRFVSAYRAQQLWGLTRGVIRYAERRVISGGTGVALLGMAVVAMSAERLPEQLVATFLVGFAVVPIWALLRIRSSIVRALGGVVSALAPDRAVREGMLVVLIGTASMGFSWNVSSPWAMAATLAGTAIGLIAVTLFAQQRYSREFANFASPIESAVPEWRRTALPLLISAGTAVLMNRTAVVMSGWLIDTTHAGLLALAANISLLVSFPQVAVNAMFTPTIAMLYKREDHRALQSIVTTAAWWITLAALGTVLPLFIFAELVLSLFGEGFTAAATAFRILLLGQFVHAAAGPVLQIMNMTGKEDHVAAILVATTVIGIGLSAVLIMGFGLNGGAAAAALTLIAWNCAMAIFVWYRLRLVPSVLGTVSWLSGGAWRG
jgi:O-antigen/teichoic acid export membrane protein